jgi:hypothetical protein
MVRTPVPRLAQPRTSAAPGHVHRDVMQAPVDAFCVSRAPQLVSPTPTIIAANARGVLYANGRMGASLRAAYRVYNPVDTPRASRRILLAHAAACA